jgi:hypothetical protein
MKALFRASKSLWLVVTGPSSSGDSGAVGIMADMDKLESIGPNFFGEILGLVSKKFSIRIKGGLGLFTIGAPLRIPGDHCGPGELPTKPTSTAGGALYRSSCSDEELLRSSTD